MSAKSQYDASKMIKIPKHETPLAKAIREERENMVSCLECRKRVVVKGASYCEVSGKLLHPMLLEGDKHKCPDAGSETPREYRDEGEKS